MQINAAFNGMLMVMIMSSGLQLRPVSGTIWTVGDSEGWAAIDYSAWSSNKVFQKGDILFFAYAQGAHDVAEVSEGDYEACWGKKPVRRWISGNTSVTLENAGAHYYFICTFQGHCPPMQLSVQVAPDNAGDAHFNNNQSSASSPPLPISASISLTSLLFITISACCHWVLHLNSNL